jgi:hypothetical protein
LSFFHPDLTVGVIGMATLLLRRITGSLSIKVQAFDSWSEMIAADELGIPEIDQNAERAQTNQRVREAFRQVPREISMRSAVQYYEFSLENRDRLAAAFEDAQAQGTSFQDFLDSQFKGR